MRTLGLSGVLTISELRGRAGQWLTLREGRLRLCGLTNLEHRTLLDWLDRACTAPGAGDTSDSPEADIMNPRALPSDVQADYVSSLPIPRVDLPPCVCGTASSLAAHDQIALEYFHFNHLSN